MKRLLKTLIFITLLIGGPVFADVSTITPRNQGGIEFVTGGADVEEYAAMRAIQGNYNTHLTFAVRGTGEYLADVRVIIRNANGEPVLDTVSEGAFLYARLVPGRYVLVAELDGHVIKTPLFVPKRHAVSLPLYLPREPGD
jgi:hypothetical protein